MKTITMNYDDPRSLNDLITELGLSDQQTKDKPRGVKDVFDSDGNYLFRGNCARTWLMLQAMGLLTINNHEYPGGLERFKSDCYHSIEIAKNRML